MDHLTFAQLLGNYGEFVGAIAVFATLGYLALQIRQNTRSVASANIFSAMHLYNEVNTMVISDPELNELFHRGTNDPESMTEVEATRFLLLMRAYNNSHFAVWWSHEEGTMPETPWLGFKLNFAGLVGTPGGKRVIDSQTDESPEYLAHLKELVEIPGMGRWSPRKGWVRE